jgi:hypothetical protein
METLTVSAASPVTAERVKSLALPWYCYAVVFGATSIIIGILWDISWHRTIGRDTFWTPAHMAIYLGGLLGGLTSGWLVLRISFWGTAEEKAGAVRCWGFHGPLGAWVCIWGALAMLTSAPFDDWWHNAYGLDVKILSPPHTVLALGMWGVVLGALMMVLRAQNLAPPDQPAPGRWLFIYASGVLVAMAAVFLIEHSWPNHQRTRTFYQLSAATYPVYLMGMARASKFRWGATMIAGVYMAVMALACWILPLFPGQPRLGPIYNPIDHFVPLAFPLLLVVPAFVVDLLRDWIGHGRGWRRDWLLVLLAGPAFFATFFVTQWFFSAFLLSPAADNWFFAADRHWDFNDPPGDWHKQFWHESHPRWNPSVTLNGMAWATLWAVCATRIGLWLGNWMAKVKR